MNEAEQSHWIPNSMEVQAGAKRRAFLWGALSILMIAGAIALWVRDGEIESETVGGAFLASVFAFFAWSDQRKAGRRN